MKTKKISVVLALVLTAGMLLAGIAHAAPELFILEIQAKGKGYEAVSEDAIVYTESRHTMDTCTLYAKCDRATGQMILAYQNAVSEAWSISASPGVMVETENKLLVNFPFITQIHTDSIGIYYSTGAVYVQFKEQEGTITSAKLKSLAMSYWQTGQYGATGNMQRFGAVKMKGKKIAWDEVPTEVQALFD